MLAHSRRQCRCGRTTIIEVTVIMLLMAAGGLTAYSQPSALPASDPNLVETMSLTPEERDAEFARIVAEAEAFEKGMFPVTEDEIPHGNKPLRDELVAIYQRALQVRPDDPRNVDVLYKISALCTYRYNSRAGENPNLLLAVQVLDGLLKLSDPIKFSQYYYAKLNLAHVYNRLENYEMAESVAREILWTPFPEIESIPPLKPDSMSLGDYFQSLKPEELSYVKMEDVKKNALELYYRLKVQKVEPVLERRLEKIAIFRELDLGRQAQAVLDKFEVDTKQRIKERDYILSLAGKKSDR